MKVPTVAAIAAIALTACGKADGGLSGEAITLDSLLTVAEAYVGDTITLRGIAVQKEGAPLYVTDSAKTNKLRIERTEGCSTDEVVEQLKQIPEVVECHYTTGDFDLFIKIYALNNHHLLNIIHDKLQPLGLARSESIISFNSAIRRQIPIVNIPVEEEV